MVFVISLKPADKEKECFGIIFRYIKLNARGIKGKDVNQKGIHLLTDRFGIIHYVLKHEFNMIRKTEFEACKKMCVRDF